jgi:16S rRNA processing protein RimM
MTQTGSINIKQLFEAGFIKKPHGVSGDVLIQLHQGININEDCLSYIFIETEGLPVPFSIEEYEWRGESMINMKLRFIDNKETAQNFVSCKVFVKNEAINTTIDELNVFMFKGFELHSPQHGFIGQIIQLDDFGGNLVMTIQSATDELLIPFHTDLLIEFNIEEKTVTLNIPEGLI